MADYTPPDYNSLLPGEPWTSAKAIAAFENLEAFAEQSPNAPKMAMKTITGQITTPGSLTFSSLGDYSGMYIRGNYSIGTPTSGVFSLTLSTDSGSSFATAQNIISLSNATAAGNIFLFVNFLDGAWRGVIEDAVGPALVSGTFASIADNVTDLRLSITTDTAKLAVIAEPRGGDAAS